MSNDNEDKKKMETVKLLILALSLATVQGRIYEGSVCGFGDVDLNKKTDLVVVEGSDKRNIAVLLAAEKSLEFEKADFTFNFEHEPEAGWTIANCAVLDFNGNSEPEIIVSWSDKSQKSTQIFMCMTEEHGPKNIFNCSNHWGEVKSQPSVGKYVATKDDAPYSDGFFFVNKDGNGSCVEGGSHPSKFEAKPCFGDETYEPHPITVYAPVTESMAPNFVIVSEKNTVIWHWTSSDRWSNRTEPLPPDTGSPAIRGFTTIGDFNADGRNEILLPRADSCTKNVCTKVILRFVQDGQDNQSSEVTLDLKEGYSVGLTTEPGLGKFHVRVGDFSLDGYPDLLLILKNADGALFVFIAHNRPMDSNLLGRTFEIDWEFNLNSVVGLKKAVFFDLGEDGDLDILTEYNNGTTDLIEFIYSQDKGDTNFFRVQAFTPSCNGHVEAGVTSTGTSLYYHSVDENGEPIHGVYTQGSQTSYGALLLPYALFGLGRTPNFVESLEVTLPGPENHVDRREWLQLIPNSRIFVIPCGEPGSWVTKLLLTPDKIILQSFAALCAICGVILIIILVLHLKERREDKRLREQESHKFHFDAM